MRFLLDNNLSPALAEALTEAGHPSMHVKEYGLAQAADEIVLDKAAAEDRVLISADTDFGTILSRRKVGKPSVILFRRPTGRRPHEQLMSILTNLDEVADRLEQGAIVVIERRRIRVRGLPILPDH